MEYLRRAKFDPETTYMEPYYYVMRQKTNISLIDDVVLDPDKPFACPDCAGTFLYDLKFLENPDFEGLYGCSGCRSVFTMKANTPS